MLRRGGRLGPFYTPQIFSQPELSVCDWHLCRTPRRFSLIEDSWERVSWHKGPVDGERDHENHDCSEGCHGGLGLAGFQHSSRVSFWAVCDTLAPQEHSFASHNHDFRHIWTVSGAARSDSAPWWWRCSLSQMAAQDGHPRWPSNMVPWLVTGVTEELDFYFHSIVMKVKCTQTHVASGNQVT
jgi:hypothetical protein